MGNQIFIFPGYVLSLDHKRDATDERLARKTDHKVAASFAEGGHFCVLMIILAQSIAKDKTCQTEACDGYKVQDTHRHGPPFIKNTVICEFFREGHRALRREPTVHRYGDTSGGIIS